MCKLYAHTDKEHLSLLDHTHTCTNTLSLSLSVSHTHTHTHIHTSLILKPCSFATTSNVSVIFKLRSSLHGLLVDLGLVKHLKFVLCVCVCACVYMCVYVCVGKQILLVCVCVCRLKHQ